GVWPALACGDAGAGADACGAGIGAVPGLQTGSTGGAKVTAGGGGATGAELVALRDDRRPDPVCGSPAAFAEAALGSGFMMLMGGIDAALGKSASTITFFCAGPAGAGVAATVAVEDGAVSATGLSVPCPHIAA